jgi:hypothetical protein
MKFMRGEPRKPATNRLPAARTARAACRPARCAAVEHHDLLAQGHGLDLVVGHVDHGRAQLAVQARQLDPGLGAQGGVQVRQRLVEQEHGGLAHDGAADRHALALAAGQGLGLALQQVFDLQDGGGAPTRSRISLSAPWPA